MALTPLETFVRDYVESIGGAWDEVEPQVYDLLVPPPQARSQLEVDEQHLLRVCFDPEAVPEHPGAQLASFGTPLIDRFLEDAVCRNRRSQLYMHGLNLNPHNLAGRVLRSLQLGEGLELRIEASRTLYFAQALFWFQATFASDQKEQELLHTAVDLYYGRQVRHQEKLLDPARLSERPSLILAEASKLSLAASYPLARAEVLRTLAARAHARDRELRERLERQAARMTCYYADLRRELSVQDKRVADDADAQTRLAARRAALEREERLRIAELRQKNSLRVHLRLILVLVIQQPKLLLPGTVTSAKRPPAPVQLVWDPLLEVLEAIPCSQCQRPTFALRVNRAGAVVCGACGTDKAK